jgi:hypothetical protein
MQERLKEITVCVGIVNRMADIAQKNCVAANLTQPSDSGRSLGSLV